MTKTTMGAMVPLTVALAFLATTASGEPSEEKKMISLTEVAPDLTPVSDYTGDLWNRGTLVGDPGGARQSLYDQGVMLDVSMTQVVQGLVDGGAIENSWGYNGLLDYGVWFDSGKLGLWPGGLVGLTAQTSWYENESFNSDVGNVSPVNYNAMWPVPFETSTELMEYYLIQGLPKDIVLIAGRINPVNFLDTSRFANQSRNQFLNTSLNNDLLWGYFLTYSTYAVILAVPLPKGFSFDIAGWTPETQPGDYGGNWNSGGAVLQVAYEWEVFDDLGGLATLVGGYSSADADALDNPRFVPGLITGNVPTKDGNWLVVLNMEQYLWKPDKGAGAAPEVRTAAFDYQEPGVGLFFRFGYTPQDRNPWNLTASGGISGRGLVPGRPYDRMGFGVWGLIASNDLKDQILVGDLVKNEVGLEAFYNFAVTPWLQVSADIQWIAPGIASNKNAVVMGTRFFIQF